MQTFGYSLVAIGLSMAIFGTILYMQHRSHRKFMNYINGLRALSDNIKTAVNPLQSQGELHFRDKSGKLCKVEIMIDYSIPASENMLPSFKGETEEQIIFAPHAAQDLAARGIPLDAILTTMLRDKGRMD